MNDAFWKKNFNIWNEPKLIVIWFVFDRISIVKIFRFDPMKWN